MQLTLNQWVESSSLSGDTKRHFRVSFFYFYLHICKICCTFAADFEKKQHGRTDQTHTDEA